MIKKFLDFIKEEISGTELVGAMGPAYGETGLQNKTISAHQTNVVEGMDGKFYTEDEFNELYHEYLKFGGGPVTGFTKENIDFMLDFLQEK